MKKHTFELEGIKYRINPKQTKYLKQLIWKEDHTITDFSPDLHKETYKRVIHKFNILPLDIEND